MEVFVRRFKRYIKGKKGRKARSLFKPVRCSRVQRSREKRCVMCLGKRTSETLTACVQWARTIPRILCRFERGKTNIYYSIVVMNL